MHGHGGAEALGETGELDEDGHRPGSQQRRRYSMQIIYPSLAPAWSRLASCLSWRSLSAQFAAAG
jgi:hypothetical protein